MRDWIMLQNRQYYITLDQHKMILGIIWNIGDIETNPKENKKQRWYGTALKRDNTWTCYGELETFSDIRQLVDDDLN